MMKTIIWHENYVVSSFLVNPQKKLGLYGLLNLLQDVAWKHATHLGHGYESMIKEGVGWVLTRQKLQMLRWPVWGEEITFRTWIRPVEGVVVVRDFEILKGDELLGQSTTQWLTLDLTTRRPSENSRASFVGECREGEYSKIDARKVSLNDEVQNINEFKVRNSDLDMNGHVNNTRYAQWILDSIPMEKHGQYILQEYEINFIAETKLNDTIQIRSAPNNEGSFQYQGKRLGDDKTVFAANIKVSAQHLAP